jgi:hypothetical protein
MAPQPIKGAEFSLHASVRNAFHGRTARPKSPGPSLFEANVTVAEIHWFRPLTQIPASTVSLPFRSMTNQPASAYGRRRLFETRHDRNAANASSLKKVYASSFHGDPWTPAGQEATHAKAEQILATSRLVAKGAAQAAGTQIVDTGGRIQL